MAILKVKDKDGNVTAIPAIVGPPGKSAYEYAQDGGYTGTEEEFTAKLAAEWARKEDIPENVLIYDEQTLVEDQQMQARKNLGLYYSSEERIVLWENGGAIESKVTNESILEKLPDRIIVTIIGGYEGNTLYEGTFDICKVNGAAGSSKWFGNMGIEGNKAVIYASGTDDTGEPFLLYTGDDNPAGWSLYFNEDYLETKDLYSAYDFIITDALNTEIIYTPLDEKYIPDTIARTSDVDSKFEEAKAYTDQVKSDIYGGVPSETLDTLTELATAFEENQDVVETLNAAITDKQDKDFVVTFTKIINDDGTVTGYSSNKTFEEIEEAIIDNKTIVGKCENNIYQLSSYMSGMRLMFTTHENLSKTHAISMSSSSLGSLIIGGYSDLNTYEKTYNRTTILSTDSTDSQYPSAKAVVDYAVAKTDIDSEISSESENPVQNKAIKEYVDNNKTLKNIEDATKFVEKPLMNGFYIYLANPLLDGWYYYAPNKLLYAVIINVEGNEVDAQFPINNPVLFKMVIDDEHIVFFTYQIDGSCVKWIYDIVNKTHDQRTLTYNVSSVDNLLSEKLTTPFTAEVGQVIAVKAVDENGKPTEWECVDITKKRELYFDITATDPTNNTTYLYYGQNEEELAKMQQLITDGTNFECEVIYNSYGADYVSILHSDNAVRCVNNNLVSVAMFDGNFSEYNEVSIDAKIDFGCITVTSAHDTLKSCKIYKLS